MIVPTIEPIALPPKAGAPSTSTTERPSFAASSAADTPDIPAPRTQMSAFTFLSSRPGGRRTVRVFPGMEVMAGRFSPRILADVIVGFVPLAPRQVRALAHRLSARRRRPDGAVQLAVCAPARRRVRTADRRHGRRAVVAGNGRGHPRRTAVARSRLGRGPAGGRSTRAVLSVAAARSGSVGGPGPARARQRLLLLLHAGRTESQAGSRREDQRRLDLRSHVPASHARRSRSARTTADAARGSLQGAGRLRAVGGSGPR